MTIGLLLLSVAAALVGLVTMSRATMAPTLMAFACFVAVLARIHQAGRHHDARRRRRRRGKLARPRHQTGSVEVLDAVPIADR